MAHPTRPSTLPLAFFACGLATTAQAAPGDVLAVDFARPVASGSGLNDAGDIPGRAYQNLDCGPFCLPPQDWVVWTDGAEVLLPLLPGFSGVAIGGINDAGQIAGTAGYVDTTAALWRPLPGGGFDVLDLGVLPGMDLSSAVGVDDQGRVVGWTTTAFFPPVAVPFVWTEAGGMVDLTSLGFPGEAPLAISPGGMVATATTWYRLGDPSSVRTLTPPPRGFLGGIPAVINDLGEQARFLVSTGPENLVYLYRYHVDGTWQPISPDGTGHLSSYGLGSIDSAGNVTATVRSTAMFAPGPDGDAVPLSTRISRAYPGVYGGPEATVAGPQNDVGEMIAQLMIGRSPRLVRLTPAVPCTSRCLVVDQLVVTARFVDDPADPGRCFPTGPAHNEARVDLVVVDENGSPVAGAQVSGRFFDDYWTDVKVNGTTDALGAVRFVHDGPCGVGAIAFLVEDVVQRFGPSTRVGRPSVTPDRTLDKTTGILSGYAIPN